MPWYDVKGPTSQWMSSEYNALVDYIKNTTQWWDGGNPDYVPPHFHSDYLVVKDTLDAKTYVFNDVGKLLYSSVSDRLGLQYALTNATARQTIFVRASPANGVFNLDDKLTATATSDLTVVGNYAFLNQQIPATSILEATNMANFTFGGFTLIGDDPTCLGLVLSNTTDAVVRDIRTSAAKPLGTIIDVTAQHSVLQKMELHPAQFGIKAGPGTDDWFLDLHIDAVAPLSGVYPLWLEDNVNGPVLQNILINSDGVAVEDAVTVKGAMCSFGWIRGLNVDYVHGDGLVIVSDGANYAQGVLIDHSCFTSNRGYGVKLVGIMGTGVIQGIHIKNSNTNSNGKPGLYATHVYGLRSLHNDWSDNGANWLVGNSAEEMTNVLLNGGVIARFYGDNMGWAYINAAGKGPPVRCWNHVTNSALQVIFDSCDIGDINTANNGVIGYDKDGSAPRTIRLIARNCATTADVATTGIFYKEGATNADELVEVGTDTLTDVTYFW